MTIYEAYQALGVDGASIGLGEGDSEGGYFCTPIGAQVIGWEGVDGIHYCFVPGYTEMVFAVNSMSCTDAYVYPLAENFTDFLRLILACGSATAAEQIICWDRAQFDAYLQGETRSAEQDAVLAQIRAGLSLTPLADPFGYVKHVQAMFHPAALKFSAEYYDVLGLDAPEEITE